RRPCQPARDELHEISLGDLLSTGERSDALPCLLWRQNEDAIVARPARETAIVQEAEKREHVLSTRAGEVASACDRDRSGRGELAHDRIGKARDGVWQEHRLGADPDNVAALGESRDELPVESILGLERG